MTLKFVGTYNDRSWVKTGITSLDVACGNTNRNTGEITLGIPTRIGIHMYGMWKCGKTHCSISIASMLAQAMGKTVLHVPIDTFDDYVLNIMENCGLTVNPHIVMEGQDFESLNGMVKEFAKPEIGVGILDSVMAVSPISEQEGSVSDANMGRRAKLIGTWVKQMFGVVKHSKEEKIFIATNHLFANIGTIPGTYTPGGRTIQGFTSLHLKIQQARKGMKPITFDNGSWLLSGKVDNTNFGSKGSEFNLFVIGGWGVHKGITAIYDCLSFGLAEEDKGNISIDGKKVGKLKTMVNDFTKDENFEPFLSTISENLPSLTAVDSKKKPAKKEKEEEEEVDEKEAQETWDA